MSAINGNPESDDSWTKVGKSKHRQGQSRSNKSPADMTTILLRVDLYDAFRTPYQSESENNSMQTKQPEKRPSNRKNNPRGIPMTHGSTHSLQAGSESAPVNSGEDWYDTDNALNFFDLVSISNGQNQTTMKRQTVGHYHFAAGVCHFAVIDFVSFFLDLR